MRDRADFSPIKEKVAFTQEYFLNRQIFKKNVGKDAFSQRLKELAGGRTVPVVIFNCLDFNWIENGQSYPMSNILPDTSTSICAFYEKEILEALEKLQEVGKIDLRIIIPDSELFDIRVFAFAQSFEQRQAVAMQAIQTLPGQLAKLTESLGNVVCTWSQYCRDFNLQSPFAYTSDAYRLIQNNPNLANKAWRQMADSKKYLLGSGVSAATIAQIHDHEIFDRVTWYCAMYLGEGKALADSGAIVLNFEDGRVPSWFQRGADGSVPILTPVDPNLFYTWRSEQRK